MSVDLYVVRAGLSWPVTAAALEALRVMHDGFAYFSPAPQLDEIQTGYFWNVGRVSINLVADEVDPDEVDPEEPDQDKEEALPYLVVSSRRGAWPWIEWTAVELARHLGARLFDPQSGKFREELRAEHDLGALRQFHDSYLREEQVDLVSSYWGFVGPDDERADGLKTFVDAFD